MPKLVRQQIPGGNHQQVIELVNDRLEDRSDRKFENVLASGEIRELLKAAQELFSVRDPANQKINRIKAVLIEKVNPRYDEHNQLTLFDTVDNYAFRDTEDLERIIIAHPDVPIRFQLKRSPVIQWKTVKKAIVDEITRLQALIDALKDTGDSRRPEYIYKKQALEWALEQTTSRSCNRLRSDFVAIGDSKTDFEEV